MGREKGYIPSIEHRRKISEANIDMKKHTEESKRKLSEAGKRNFNDLTGFVFGILTVVKKQDFKLRENGRILWLCKCECGNEKTISSSNLKSGNTTSCGCKQKAILKELVDKRKERYFGQNSINATYYTYLRRAAKKEIEFSFSIYDFVEICTNDCYYCGGKPSNKAKNPYGNGDFIYNGIDRKNNEFGYTKDNCVPCCKKCNTAKGTMSVDEFLNHIYSIIENLSGTFKATVVKYI